MVLTGTYEHSIDAKRRLAIPSDLRRQLTRGLEQGGDDGVFFYVTLGDDGVLLVYTEAMFNQRAGELDHSDLDTAAVLAYERLFYSQSRLVELDKQGRIRLPAELLSQAGLSGDVVVLGVKDHLEIRDRGAWQAELEALLAARSGMMMNPRGLMRPERPK